MNISIVGIKERICQIISESTNFAAQDLNEQQDQHLHKDLGIDSLTLLEIALSIDQEFDTDFSEEELLGMESVEKATAMVAERLEIQEEAAAVG